MKYIKTFWDGVKEGLPHSDAVWWGKNLAGATFYFIGARCLGLDDWQFFGVLFIIMAANTWQDD